MQHVAYLVAILGAFLKLLTLRRLLFNKSGRNPESGQNYAGAGFRPDSEK